MKESKNQRIEGSKIERVQEPGRELPSIVFLRVASCFSAWRHSCKRVKTRWRSFKSSLHVETLRSSFDSSTRVIENRKVVSKIVVLNLNKYRLDKSRSESRAKRDPNEKSGDQERERENSRRVIHARDYRDVWQIASITRETAWSFGDGSTAYIADPATRLNRRQPSTGLANGGLLGYAETTREFADFREKRFSLLSREIRDRVPRCLALVVNWNYPIPREACDFCRFSRFISFDYCDT